MERRNYDKEFKSNAIKLYQNGKKPSEICKDLGIPSGTFFTWLNQFLKEGKKSFPGSGNIKSSNDELYKLKKELDDTKLERDILKKALAIFSRPK
jgi:transposase-like protein